MRISLRAIRKAQEQVERAEAEKKKNLEDAEESEAIWRKDG